MTIYSPFYNATNCNHKRLQGSFSRYKNPNLRRNYTSVNYEGYGRIAYLAGRKTNHSAQKTTCTKLLHASIVSTTIQQLTGHINVQSVKNYAIASVEMQKNPKIMLQTQNNMLYVQFQLTRCSNPPPNSIITTLMSAISSNGSFHQSLSARELFANARMMNCTITINNYDVKLQISRKCVRVFCGDNSE